MDTRFVFGIFLEKYHFIFSVNIEETLLNGADAAIHASNYDKC